MPLDAISLRAVVEELRPQLLNLRIDKVQQPARDQVILLLRGNKRLLLNAGANAPRLQLTELLRDNPAEPPMFCMLLRKHLAGARLLEREGCTVLAIPCNTSHYFADRLQGELHIPLIHMIRETVSAIRAMGKTTVGILATDGTVRTGIYQQALEAAGLTPVTLPAQLQRVVMSIIYDEIKKGETGSREKFGEIDAYLRQAGCDCAILGCTELPLAAEQMGLITPTVDPTEELAKAAIRFCGYRVRE